MLTQAEEKNWTGFFENWWFEREDLTEFSWFWDKVESLIRRETPRTRRVNGAAAHLVAHGYATLKDDQ